MNPRVVAILRQLAERDAERAQLQLELAALLEQEASDPTPKRRASRPRRIVAVSPSPVVAPATEPSEMDRARARKQLQRLGYRTSGR